MLINGITLCVTTCDRYDMLLRTLTSFFEMNRIPIRKTLITEDSGKDIDYKEVVQLLKIYSKEHEIIRNETNIGQIASIDKMYPKVETKWIFHSEDDIEYVKKGFVRKSLQMFRDYDSRYGRLFTVGGFPTDDPNHMWIRPKRLGESLMLAKTECKLMTQRKGEMGGFALTHGLRRTRDCLRFGPYSEVKSKLKTQEWDIGKLYLDKGYRTAVPLDGPYVKMQSDHHQRSCYKNGYSWRIIE